MWDRKELKRRGKAAFKANYWKCVLVALLLALFVVGSGTASGSGWKKQYNGGNSGSFQGELTVGDQSVDLTAALNEAAASGAITEEQAQELGSALQEILNDPEAKAALAAIVVAVIGIIIVVSIVSALMKLLVFNPLEIGCRGFFARNTELPAELGEMRRGFKPSYGRNVGGMFLRDLFIFLWSLLFIIPGIIKAYSYRMVPYILADDPSIGGKDAITASRQMMDGHKWNTFVLDLSFIGWGILSVLTLGILGIFYVHPYKASTDAELYETLKSL